MVGLCGGVVAVLHCHGIVLRCIVLRGIAVCCVDGVLSCVVLRRCCCCVDM